MHIVIMYNGYMGYIYIVILYEHSPINGIYREYQWICGIYNGIHDGIL
jgi:hypothetical protein